VIIFIIVVSPNSRNSKYERFKSRLVDFLVYIQNSYLASYYLNVGCIEIFSTGYVVARCVVGSLVFNFQHIVFKISVIVNR